jgi:superfamily I DNA and/or RNA helicase
VPTDIDHLMNGGSVTTRANAQVLVRSFVFWTDMGLDHFIHSPPGAPDNRPVLNDSTVADHERMFTNAVRQLVKQGFLERDIANDVTHELTVTTTAAKEFVVTPTTEFYRLALMLAGAFFSSLEAQLFALFNRRPSPGLTYMKWNMKAKSFKELLDSAKKRPERKDLERWALRTKVRRGEFDEPRSNAIKLEFLVRAYTKLFPPIGDFPTPSPSTRLA